MPVKYKITIVVDRELSEEEEDALLTLIVHYVEFSLEKNVKEFDIEQEEA